jgi:tetratricopeptide (TPR) repeat protein
MLFFLGAVVAAYFWIKSPPRNSANTSQAAPADTSLGASAMLSHQTEQPMPEFAIAKSEDAPAVFSELTDTENARKELREVTAQARQLFIKGQFAEALVLLKKIEPKDKSVLAAIGYIYYHMRNIDEAIAAFEESLLYKTPNEYNVRKYLVELYLHKGNRLKAKEHLTRALAVRQDDQLKALAAWMQREDTAHAGYVDEKGDRFQVTFDGHAVGNASRMVLGILDDAYRTIGREMNYYPTKTFRVIIYTQQDFHDVTRMPGWAGGAYGIRDGVIRIPVRGAEGQERELKRVLFHEYTHALIHTICPNPPRLLNEGLAEYMSGKWPSRTTQKIPLHALHDNGSFARLGDVRLVYFAYWESYSAVAYLIDRYGMDRVMQLLRMMGSSADVNRAFTESIGISYNDLVATWEPEWKQNRRQ